MVGAGHNGLVCAIRLAVAGARVEVLEQAPRPGGGVRSSQETLPGFVHDVCAGFFPQTLASPAFRELALEIDWINPPLAMAHVFGDGAAIALHRELAATAASLDRSAPGAGAAWTRLVERLAPHREALYAAVLGRFPPLRPGLRLAAALRRDGIDLAGALLGSSASFGRDLFGDERAAAWLSGSVGHADLGPGSALGGGIAFGLAFLGQTVGWPYPRGGAAKLTDALLARLTELGGEVRCATPVEAIEVQGGRVRGVRAGGATQPADAVVATISPRPLLALLPPSALGERVHGRLARWRYGLGTFKLDLALAGPVPWRSAEAREAAVVHVGGGLDDLFLAVHQSGRGEVPERPTLVVGQQSLHDATRAPAGQHTLYVYTRLPQRPALGDEAIAEVMERRIEEFAPGFRQLVLARSMRSPARLEAENPSLGGGDLAAGSMELDQQLLFRPAPELVRYRTPVRGLYVAGGWIHPGPGVHGVSGAGAAEALLADSSPLRFWRG